MNFEKNNNIKTAKVEQEKGLEETSFFDKAEAGFLLKPQSIKNELENLREEIKNMEKSFAQPGSLKSENEEIEKLIPIKESQIRKLETVLTVTEDKIKNDYEKKGPNNVDLIIDQEEKILQVLKKMEDLEGAELAFVPMARDVIHEWNVTDSKNYFTNERKIAEVLLMVYRNKKNKKDFPVETPENKSTKKDTESLVEDISGGDVESVKDSIINAEEGIEDGEDQEGQEDEDMESVNENVDNDENVIEVNIGGDAESVAVAENDTESDIENDTENDIENNAEVDTKKRNRIFDRIRGSKRLKWLMMLLALSSCSLEKLENNEKESEKNKTENTIDVNEKNDIDSDNIAYLDASDFSASENLDTAKVFASDISEKINSAVADTISKEITSIAKTVVLAKGDGVGLINDYKMPNNHKVNFIDGRTGSIHKDLAAISKTVHEGDVVMQSEDGGIYVLCFNGVSDSKIDAYEDSNNISPDLALKNDSESNLETNINAGADNNNIEQSNTSSNIESDSIENSTISLDSAEVIDLTPALKEFRAQQRAEMGDTLAKSSDSLNVKDADLDSKLETSDNAPRKKNFFQRLFQKKDKNKKEEVLSTQDESNKQDNSNKTESKKNDTSVNKKRVNNEVKSNIDVQDLLKRIEAGKVDGLKIEEGKKVNIDKDTLVSLNEVVSSLDTLEAVSIKENTNISSTTNNSKDPKYIIEKVYDNKEVLPYQVQTTLTFRKVNGGYFVENSDGTNSFLTIEDSVMKKMDGYGQEVITNVKINDTWHSVLKEVKP